MLDVHGAGKIIKPISVQNKTQHSLDKKIRCLSLYLEASLLTGVFLQQHLFSTESEHDTNQGGGYHGNRLYSTYP